MPTLPRVSPALSTYRGLRYPSSPLGSFALFSERHGDTYEVWAGSRGWTLVTHRCDFVDHVLRARHRNYVKSPIVTELLAGYIGHGLLTVEGERWRAQRRLIQPGFHRERLAGLLATVDEEARRWVRELPSTDPVDLYATTLPLALQIMARVLFSGRVTPGELTTIARSVELGQVDFARELRQPLLKPWRRLTDSRAAADRENRRTVEILARQIAEHRRRAGDFDDLLAMLLESRYDDGAGMTDAQLVDETLVLILAGHETTAIALACTAWLLSRHPGWARRCQEEWRGAVGRGGALTPEHLRALPVLTAVIREGLRLYPPAYLLNRVAVEDDEFDGVPVRAGQMVMLYVYGAHRDPGAFDRPGEFRPERYLDGETNVNYAFGAGPKLCVGVHLAMMELQVALGRLLERYTPGPAGADALELDGAATMAPSSGTWVALT